MMTVLDLIVSDAFQSKRTDEPFAHKIEMAVQFFFRDTFVSIPSTLLSKMWCPL